MFRTAASVAVVKSSASAKIWPLSTVFSPNFNASQPNGGITVIFPNSSPQYDYCTTALSNAKLSGIISAVTVDASAIYNGALIGVTTGN